MIGNRRWKMVGELLDAEFAEEFGCVPGDLVDLSIRDMAEAIIGALDSAPYVRGTNKATGEVVEGPFHAVADTLTEGWSLDPAVVLTFYCIPRPEPKVREPRDIQEAVIEDVKVRREFGVAKYGTGLQANNGRNALVDAYDEALDLVQYLKQMMVEAGVEYTSEPEPAPKQPIDAPTCSHGETSGHVIPPLNALGGNYDQPAPCIEWATNSRGQWAQPPQLIGRQT